MTETLIKHRRDLYQLLDGLPMVAAEIGVAEGRFSLEMMRWGLERLYCVDAWKQLSFGEGDGQFPQHWHEKNLMETKHRLAEFGDKVVILRGLTHEMAAKVPRETLGLIYVDADHSFEGVKRDLQAWVPKVVPGGIVAGHDYYGYVGVKKAVDGFVKANGYQLHIIDEDEPANASYWFRV